MAKGTSESKTTWTLLMMMGMSTAFLLVVPVLILLTIGFFVDKIFHTTPFYMLLGITLGLVGGIMNVFRLLQAMQKNKLKTKKEI
jgi:F0F1-type ATP synthase assembly protein I